MANLKSVIGRLKTAYRDWEAGAEDRVAKKLARVESKGERDKIVHRLKMEKLERRQQLEDATAKAREAEARRKKAERSIKQIGGDGFVSRLFGTSKSSTVRRRASKRKLSAKK